MMAVALMAASCANDVNEVLTPEAPAQQGYHFIATIAPKTFDATTRTLLKEEDDNSLSSTWVVEDEILIEYLADASELAQVTARVTAVAADGSATIEANLTIEPYDTGAEFNADLTYPASDPQFANQDGTLSAARDLRYGQAKLKADGSKITFAGTPSLEAEGSIFKFTMKDLKEAATNVDKLVISSKDYWDEDDGLTITVTPTAAASELYVTIPIPDTGSVHTFWFEATSGSSPYIAQATGSLEIGYYYQSTLKMATLGDLMNSDGSFSAEKEDGKTPIGVIAYLGNDATVESAADGGGHGLVLALKNAANSVIWGSNATAWQFGEDFKVTDRDALLRTKNVSGYSNTKDIGTEDFPVAYAALNYIATAPPGTTGWFLPSAQQWVKMMTGLGGLSETDIVWESWFDNNHTAADKWEAALEKAGEGNYDSVTSHSLWYWSSSEYSQRNVVRVFINATLTGDGYGFSVYHGDKSYRYDRWVRSVLAF